MGQYAGEQQKHTHRAVLTTPLRAYRQGFMYGFILVCFQRFLMGLQY